MFLPGSLFILAAAYALGAVVFRSLTLPHVARFGLGAAVESIIVFLLLQAGWAGKWSFLLIGTCALAALFRWRPARLHDTAGAAPDRTAQWMFGTVLAAYSGLYAICALAPEIQPDAITYHLGLAAEYVRLGHFPARIGFYEMLPQGLEMLFTSALALGGPVAAKLIHFAFLLGTVPLMLAIGRALRLSGNASLGAGVLYLCMPVAGVTGTSAYTDAALVFYTLLAFYLLLLWNNTRRAGYAAAAGFAAGFCYAVKITGLPVAAAVVVASMVLARSAKPVAIMAAGTAVSVAPWMLRALLLTGNPVAPLWNRVFPNPYFNTTTEAALGALVSSYGSFHWSTAPLEYAFRGGMQGITGPLLLMLPLGLLALRTRAGRLLFIAAGIAVVPWCWNAGARFLMPGIAFLALALAMALPRWLLFLCVGVQAILCWPAIADRLEDPNGWSLHEIPWRAAFRMESADDYLRRSVGEYPVARMVEDETRPGDRIFCLTPTARVYTTRELVDYWHSTPLEQLSDALRLALAHEPMQVASAQWPEELLRAMRISAESAARGEWRVFEFTLFSPGGRIYPSPQWSLDGKPNRWDAPWAVDGNRSTAWRARDNIHRGMYLGVDMGRPQLLSGIAVLEQTPPGMSFIVDGMDRKGRWKHLADSVKVAPAPPDDLRVEAVSALRRAGFRYILAEAGDHGVGMIGADMAQHPAEWGLRDVAETTPVHLFRIF